MVHTAHKLLIRLAQVFGSAQGGGGREAGIARERIQIGIHGLLLDGAGSGVIGDVGETRVRGCAGNKGAAGPNFSGDTWGRGSKRVTVGDAAIKDRDEVCLIGEERQRGSRALANVGARESWSCERGGGGED